MTWISVDEKLPHDRQVVLCYQPILHGDSHVEVGRYNKDENLFEVPHVCEYHYLDEVTHWMPLPQYPSARASNTEITLAGEKIMGKYGLAIKKLAER